MRKGFILAIILLFMILSMDYCASKTSLAITLTSSAFSEGQEIPFQYARTGSNVSPPLTWKDVPYEQKVLSSCVWIPTGIIGCIG